MESIDYTQGYYDFVDIVDARNPEAFLSFSVWYAAQGMGRIESMPQPPSIGTLLREAP